MESSYETTKARQWQKFVCGSTDQAEALYLWIEWWVFLAEWKLYRNKTNVLIAVRSALTLSIDAQQLYMRSLAFRKVLDLVVQQQLIAQHHAVTRSGKALWFFLLVLTVLWGQASKICWCIFLQRKIWTGFIFLFIFMIFTRKYMNRYERNFEHIFWLFTIVKKRNGAEGAIKYSCCLGVTGAPPPPHRGQSRALVGALGKKLSEAPFIPTSFTMK